MKKKLPLTLPLWLLSVPALAEEEAAAPASVFGTLAALPWYTYALLAALLAGGIILIVGSKQNRWNSRRIAMGAMSVAIAFVLSCIKLISMPQGGFVSPASMLPIVLFMVAFGPLHGFVAGCAFGLLQLITDPM